MELITQLLMGKVISVYLDEGENPLTGYFRAAVDGFFIISETPDGPVTLIDREAVWCVTEQPSGVKAPEGKQ